MVCLGACDKPEQHAGVNNSGAEEESHTSLCHDQTGSSVSHQPAISAKKCQKQYQLNTVLS